MYSGLYRPETRRRRVLQRESRRRFDGSAVPQERAEAGRHCEPGDPQHARHRLAENAVPCVRPRQFRSRRGRHVDARPHASPGCAAAGIVAESSTLLPLTARSRQAAPMPKPTEHCPRDIAGQRDRDVGPLNPVVPGLGDDVPEEHRPGRRGLADGFSESLVGTGGAGVEDPGDAVADLEDVGAIGRGTGPGSPILATRKRSPPSHSIWYEAGLPSSRIEVISGFCRTRGLFWLATSQYRKMPWRPLGNSAVIVSTASSWPSLLTTKSAL